MGRARAQFELKPLLTWVGVVVLAVVVFALVMASLQLGAAAGEQPERRPAELIADLSDPEPLPTEQPPALPELSPTGASLSLADESVLWRAAAATCTADAAASVDTAVAMERSADAQTWVSVTPAGIDVREVLWLQAIDAVTAEAVVRVGPECETQVLRTFTGGTFWQAYPASITGAAAIDASAGVLRTPTAELSLPCEVPAQAVAGAPAAAPVVICAGQVSRWIDAAWQPLELANVVAASAATDGALVTAREAVAECDGVLLEQWGADGASLAQLCTPGSGVLAVQAAGPSVWVWSAAGVETMSWES
ncbi:hypothetical protein ACR5KS_08460 [Leucobacter sp. W1153]|uniref:hypothetical protein n=1 Tax=Leucobacter sp. W1153 TaxID=3439064 RepID=UPI003F2D79DF